MNHYTTGAKLERVARIELACVPWQGTRLLLRHTRIKLVSVVELESTTHGPKPRMSPSTPHRVKIMYFGKLLLFHIRLLKNQ